MLRVLVAALFVVSLPAQGLRGPVHKPDPDTAWNRENRDLSRIVVKFAEGTRVRLRDGRWAGAAGLDAAHRLVDGARVERLFQRGEAALDAERDALLRDVPAGMDPPADLNNYFIVRARDAGAGLGILRGLNRLAVVELAFPEHRETFACEPGDIPPLTPSFESMQLYRNSAPTGIDHRAGRVIGGGRGRNLQIIDVESSWRLNHEDIPRLVPENVIGSHTESLNPNHGGAVLGELAAEWDEFGVTGLVDRTAVKVHSHMRQFWASAVNVAAANSPVGGFIVLEVQLSFQGRTVPMESRQDVFDAVRNATMAGKFVVAAAGNGSQNLDDPVFQGIFNRAQRDSGSIIVGATEGSTLIRASFSNYGSIVDANGWGRNVTTTGYGDLFSVPGDPRQDYTAVFSGTSSATPIVTGASMALVGATQEQQGRLLTPLELRGLLRQHGTAVPGGQIGPRPDMVKLLAAVGLPNGLDLPVEGRLGQTMTVELSGPAQALYALAAAPQPGFVDLGPAGRFLLDPATAVVPFGGAMPAGGLQTFSIVVPNDVMLKYATLHLQGALVDRGVLSLTSSVQNYVY